MALPAALRAHFAGKRVLITGGLGFLGSSLALELVDSGANVLVVDALLPNQGGNRFNLNPAEGRVRINIADIRNRNSMRVLVQEQDFLFNCSASLSHTGSMDDPFTDLENNCQGHLSLLEACRLENRALKIVLAATRSQYGPALRLPVEEDHPQRPRDVNGIHHIASEAYHLLYQQSYGIRVAVLRLPNLYGPRQQMRHGQQGFLNWFMRRALDNESLSLFGDGAPLRDFNYVDDAVAALLLAAANPAADGEVFNLGCPEPLTVRAIAERIVHAAGRGRVEMVPYPTSAQRVEVGDFYCDYSKIRRMLGWEPVVDFDEGLRRTLDYYRANREQYWTTALDLEP